MLLEALEEHLVPLAQRVLAFELHCVRGRTGGPVHEIAVHFARQVVISSYRLEIHPHRRER